MEKEPSTSKAFKAAIKLVLLYEEAIDAIYQKDAERGIKLTKNINKLRRELKEQFEKHGVYPPVSEKEIEELLK